MASSVSEPLQGVEELPLVGVVQRLAEPEVAHVRAHGGGGRQPHGQADCEEVAALA
jgi:hypothetical protein